MEFRRYRMLAVLEEAMAECEKIAVCPFFNDKIATLPAVATMMKNRYCLGDKNQCARYMVSCAGLPAPLDLFPYERNRVDDLLRRKM